MTDRFFPLLLLWLGCMLVILRCAIAIGVELSYAAPSWLVLAGLVTVIGVMIGSAGAITVAIDDNDRRHRDRGSAAFTLMVLLSLAGLCVASPGCAWLKGEGKAAGKTVVDCTVAQAKKLTAEFAPTFEQLLQRATGNDGRIDWPSIEDATRNLSEVGWCALENTVARMLQQIPAAGSPQSSPLPMGYDELMHGLAELRHKKHQGKTFKTQ